MESQSFRSAGRCRSTLVALAVLVVSGCGTHHDDHLYGRFETGTVTGLRYTTPSGTGLTGTDGNFKYRPGETVTFSIGGITLGSAPGARMISPFTLAGIEPPATESAVRAQFTAVFRKNGAMMRVVRTTKLLLALDLDGDPENGIDLTGRDAQLAQSNLDLGRDEGTFGDAIERLADDTNVGVPQGNAVRYLFEKLGIDMRAHALVSESNDLDGDGTPEFLQGRSYGVDGSIVSTFDSNADGNPDSTTTTFTDRMGRDLGYRIDFDNDDDGVIDAVQTNTLTFDAHGRTLLQVTDNDEDADGVVDHRSTVAYTIGSNGRMSGWVNDDDANFDGLVDGRRTATLTYDDRRNQTDYFNEWDSGVDGVIDFRERITNTYNASDQIIKQDGLADFDGNSVNDWRLLLESTYDTTGQWVSGYQDIDEGNDGTVDTHIVSTREYDESGNETALTSTIERFSPPSRTTSAIFSTYDAMHGPLTVVREMDLNGDGTSDSRRSETTTYDTDGRELSVVSVVDSDGDGTANINSTETMTYGADGEFLESIKTTDSNGDGTVDTTFITRKTYTVVDDGLTALVYEYFGY